jgi:glycosyltransferase involved in cell wall biosynthesis
MDRARHALNPVVIAPARGPLTDAIERLGVRVHIIPYPLRFRRGLIPAWRPGPSRKIEALARELRPALIHVFHFFGMLPAGPVAKKLSLPLVWTCHGDFELSNAMRRWVARRWATHAACVADSGRRVAAAVLGEGRVSLNYLGILPFHAQGAAVGRDAIRAEFNEPLDAPIIGVIGRFQPVKGHQHLLDALPAMLKSVPNLRVWIIGDALSGSEIEARHKELIERRGHRVCHDRPVPHRACDDRR